MPILPIVGAHSTIICHFPLRIFLNNATSLYATSEVKERVILGKKMVATNRSHKFSCNPLGIMSCHDVVSLGGISGGSVDTNVLS